MNFDFGEVLRRTWNIGWNHKVLWVYQMLPGLLGLLIMPIFFLGNPAFAPFLPEPFSRPMSDTNTIRFVIFTMVATAILLIPAMFLGVLVQGATTFGALEADKGAGKFSFREGIKGSMPYFWRMFGLYALFGTIWAAVVFALVALNIAGSLVTFIAPVFLMPLIFLLIPFFLLGYILLQLAQAALIIDNMTMQAALARSWQMFRSNILAVVLLMLMLYVATSIISSIFIFPMMIPMGFLPFAIQSANDVRTPFALIFFVFFPAMTIVMTVVQGILMAFFQAAWVVTYRYLSGRQNTPVVVEAHA